MKHTGAWKAFERRAAELFGGIRSAFSGAQPQVTGTRGDVRHPHLFIECKYRQRHSIAALMKDTRIKADAERKIPVIVLKEHGQRGCIIAVHSDDLDRLSKAGRYDDLPLFQREKQTMAANEQLIDVEPKDGEPEEPTDEQQDDLCGFNWGCGGCA